MGIQHVLAMFGSTVLAPIIMGFDTNVAIFFSAVGTLLFFLITGGRIPSYLGSSFAFIAPVIAVTGGMAGSPDIPKALGGIVICGVVYTIIGLIVHYAGSEWIDALMPPIVTGAVVAIIGLNLAGAARGMAQDNMTLAILTILATVGVALIGRGLIGRLPILLGTAIGYLVALFLGGTSTAGRDIGPWHITGVDLQQVRDASWVGMPNFQTPSFEGSSMLLIAPVAIILVAENTGHIKAVSEMTNRNLMPWLGRGFIGDGVATTLSGFGGGPGVTTYAENIGVMAVTRVFSTAIFLIASAVALLLSFSPKFGALVSSIPLGVLGGVATVLFGLIAAAGIRIWIDNRVDFSKGVNLFIASVTLIVGTADYTIFIGDFALNGIALGTFGSIILYQIFQLVPGALEEDPGATPASAGLDVEYGGAAAGPGVRWGEEQRFEAERPQRAPRPTREPRESRPERRPAPRPEFAEELEGFDVDEPEVTRPRQQPGRRPQPPRRAAAPPVDDFGFGEPVERPSRVPQPPRRPRPEQPSRRSAPAFDQGPEDVVIDDPAAMPRSPRAGQEPRRPRPEPVREEHEAFGFDEPMPVPQQPRPPRVQRRPRPQQPTRRPAPDFDDEPPPPPRRRQ
jgi:uracil-xanthine permease